MSEADRMSELDKILNHGAGSKGAKADASPVAAGGEIDESGLPEPDADYKAYANVSSKPVYSLHCLKGAEGIFSFQYVNLDSHSHFRAGEHGQVITLRFAGTQIWEVTITGTSLRKLYDGIHRHVIAWVRKSDRGFAAGPDGEPFIKGIDIKPIPREE